MGADAEGEMSIEAMKQALEYTRPGAIVPVTPETVKMLVDALRLAIEQAERQESYWQEEARRYAGNADFWREKAKAAVAAEQTAVLQTIEEFMGSEQERHPMFSDGYDYALSHIQQFIKGRQT
jgi:hypothetical protein